MFIYDDDGLPVGYDTGNQYPEEHAVIIEQHMLEWFRSLPGQARRRLGKVGIMQGSAPNLNRLENE